MPFLPSPQLPDGESLAWVDCITIGVLSRSFGDCDARARQAARGYTIVTFGAQTRQMVANFRHLGSACCALRFRRCVMSATLSAGRMNQHQPIRRLYPSLFSSLVSDRGAIACSCWALMILFSPLLALIVIVHLRLCLVLATLLILPEATQHARRRRHARARKNSHGTKVFARRPRATVWREAEREQRPICFTDFINADVGHSLAGVSPDLWPRP